MGIATIEELEDELLTVVRSVPAFAKNGFSVFDEDEMSEAIRSQALPCVGVAYNGAEPISEGTPKTNVHGAALIDVQFVIVIAIQYRYTGQRDTKQQAFSLLHQVRSALLGYKGSNSRPWRFVGERPESEASGDGVALYSQVWQTTLPIVGNFNF